MGSTPCNSCNLKHSCYAYVISQIDSMKAPTPTLRAGLRSLISGPLSFLGNVVVKKFHSFRLLVHDSQDFATNNSKVVEKEHAGGCA